MKKAKKICTTAVIVIAIAICTLLAHNHFSYKEEIAVNGAVYTQKGDNISVLPADSVELGYLRSISHKSVDNPTGDFTGTNLDEKYAGCPIYQSAENDEIIYLEDYSGFYIPFELSEYIAPDENETVLFHREDESSPGKITFEAEVLEIYDSYILAKPESSWEINSADQIEVPMKNMDSALEPEVGDIIEIAYSGEILETYPARIHEVYSIKVVEEAR